MDGVGGGDRLIMSIDRLILYPLILAGRRGYDARIENRPFSKTYQLTRDDVYPPSHPKIDLASILFTSHCAIAIKKG